MLRRRSAERMRAACNGSVVMRNAHNRTHINARTGNIKAEVQGTKAPIHLLPHMRYYIYIVIHIHTLHPYGYYISKILRSMMVMPFTYIALLCWSIPILRTIHITPSINIIHHGWHSIFHAHLHMSSILHTILIISVINSYGIISSYTIEHPLIHYYVFAYIITTSILLITMIFDHLHSTHYYFNDH
jgi:hypothetical protein